MKYRVIFNLGEENGEDAGVGGSRGRERI